MAPDWKTKAKAASANRKAQQGGPRPPLTHFLCLQLVTSSSRPILETAIQHFKTQAKSLKELDKNTSNLFDQRSLRPVGTLHLTLGVMSLTSKERVDEAVRFLNGIDLDALLRQDSQLPSSSASAPKNEPGSTKSPKIEPLSLSLMSLNCMGSPSSTSVLYVEPQDSSNRLRPLCESLRAAFQKQGLMLPDDRPLKLHVTILNSIYAVSSPRAESGVKSSPNLNRAKPEAETPKPNKDLQRTQGSVEANASASNSGRTFNKSNEGRGGRTKPLSFDAELLLNTFKSFQWASSIQVERIAICKMGADKVLDASGNVVDEAYDEIAYRNLPA